MGDELSIDSKALIFATLADVYLSSGMVDEAISILKDGLSRNPKYTLGKIILGRAFYMKGQTAEALSLLEGIYEEARDSENANLYIARCHARIGNAEQAVKYYEAVLNINPQNLEAKSELATVAVKEREIAARKEKEPPKEAVPFDREALVVAVPIMEEPSRKEEPLTFERPPENAEIETVAVEKEAPELPGKTAAAEAPVEPASKIETPVKVEPVRAEPAPEVRPEPAAPAAVTGAKEDLSLLPEIGLETTGGETTTVAPLESLVEPVKRLLALKTVKGSFICSRDGLLIQNYYETRSDIEEVSALIAAICNEADEAFGFLKEGKMEKCVIEKDDEAFCIISAGESLLCIVTQSEAKPGLVFVYARKIIDQIRQILG